MGSYHLAPLIALYRSVCQQTYCNTWAGDDGALLYAELAASFLQISAGLRRHSEACAVPVTLCVVGGAYYYY